MRIARLLLAFFALAASAQDLRANDKLFEQLDRNRNGSLEQDEINQEHRRLFQRLLRVADGNQDGMLSTEEFQSGLESKQPDKPLPKKIGSELPGADALLLLLARMDANADGRIEKDEVPDPFRNVFDRIEDRLGGEADGVLDRRELMQAGPRLSRVALNIAERMNLDVEVELALLPEKQWQTVQNLMGPRRRGELLADPQGAREFFRQLDADGDGQITLAEVPDALVERFELLMDRADRDENDQISEQELMTMSQHLKELEAKRPAQDQLQQGVKRMLKQWDVNGDQQLSREELPRRMAGRFDRLDIDGNGQLDRDELVRLVELVTRLRQGDGGQRRGSVGSTAPQDSN